MAEILTIHRRLFAAAVRTLVVGAVFCCAAADVLAQGPPHWRVFSSLDGLQESWVADVSRGPSGRVYITHGDVATMSVYDGFRFTRLPSPGPNLTVREAPGGRLWALLQAGGENLGFRGLQSLDGGRWTSWPISDVQPFAQMRRDFLPWATDRVLIVTPERLVEFDAATARTRDLATATGLSLGPFLACEAARSGGAWVAAARGIVRLSPTGAVGGTWPFPPAIGTARGVSVTEASDGALILTLGGRLPAAGFPQRVVRMKDSTFTMLAESTAADGASLAAWPGIDGRWWLATIRGATFELTVHAGQRSRTLPRTGMLSGQWSAVTPDEAGGMWIATALGLVRHMPAAWREPVGIPDPSRATGAILQARDGSLFVLQQDTLLHSADGVTWRSDPLPAGTDARLYLHSALAELPDGRIAIGQSPGLRTFDPSSGRFGLAPPPPGASAVVVVGAAPTGRPWLVANPNGDPSWMEPYGTPRSGSRIDGGSHWHDRAPREIVETASGDLFVVPDGTGVGRVRNGVLEHLDATRGYPGDGPFCGAEVAPGRLWFGDRDSVIEFDGSRWRTVRTGLQSVRTIRVGRDRTVWVASGTGLHRYRYGSWLTMAAADGLPDGALVSVFEDRTGRLWVTTTAGIARYHPEADTDAPETWIDPAVNLREVSPLGSAHLVFHGADRWAFSPSGRLLYAWRVDAGPWSSFSELTSANVGGLAAGWHRFEARAMDRNGNVDATPALFKFDVLRPWYLASGFLLFGIPALLLAGGGMGLLVTRYLRLERLVDERTRALQEANLQLRREAEDRRRAEAQFHQAQKLEAVGRLAGGVAHDFNNLLTVISGYADLLRADLAATDPRTMPVDEIARAATRAAGLTRQLLAFGRHQVTHPESLDLNAVVHDIFRMLGRLIGEDVSLVFEPTPDLWPVHADRGQLEQVLVNLAVNARDAMPDGGRLVIALENTTADEEFCRQHHGARPGPHVLLSVSDSGIGMDADTVNRVFEPFFSTKEPAKGTGLGLSVVYGIVSGAGGSIVVRSEPGHGTTFEVYLPRGESGDVVAAGGEKPTPTAAHRGTETVLVVEDDPAVRSLTVASLRRYGYRVLEAASAEEAEACADASGGQVSLVLTDIVMPGRSGPDVAKRMRARWPALRVVFMSGYAGREVLGEGLRDGEVAFIQKPFTPESLARKVRETLDR
ncbi:MAG TPA: ATP-binding protein [Vicinamibacterales bacterium]|jgi:signal transduction histidine kinase/CheY-like chemotaxis protein